MKPILDPSLKLSTLRRKLAVVTGAGGYVGSTLSSELIKNGYHVIGVDQYYFGIDLVEDLVETGCFTVMHKDIRDMTVEDLDGVYAVFDLASISNDPSGDLDPTATFAINRDGRIHVANMAKRAGVERYVLAGSCSVYGAGHDTSLTEESKTNPLTAYAKASLAAEQAALALSSDEFCVTVLRQATVFGTSRRMRFDLVANIMANQALTDKKIVVRGGGEQWRPFVHVLDTSRAFITVAEAPSHKVNGEVFNVVRENVTILDLAVRARSVTDISSVIEVVQENADQRNYNVSGEKLKRVLGFQPSVSIEQGIADVYVSLRVGMIEHTPRTITLDWYKHLMQTGAPSPSTVIVG